MMSVVFLFLTWSLYVSAGVVSWNSKPQPKARPSGPGTGTGLLPGDRPAESPCHPLQEWVRENKTGVDGQIQTVWVITEPQKRQHLEKKIFLYSARSLSLKVELFLSLEVCVCVCNKSFSGGNFPPTSQLQYCKNADVEKSRKVSTHLSFVQSAAVVPHTAEIVPGPCQLFLVFLPSSRALFFYNPSQCQKWEREGT